MFDVFLNQNRCVYYNDTKSYQTFLKKVILGERL